MTDETQNLRASVRDKLRLLMRGDEWSATLRSHYNHDTLELAVRVRDGGVDVWWEYGWWRVFDDMKGVLVEFEEDNSVECVAEQMRENLEVLRELDGLTPSSFLGIVAEARGEANSAYLMYALGELTGVLTACRDDPGLAEAMYQAVRARAERDGDGELLDAARTQMKRVLRGEEIEDDWINSSR